jgi:hypothetical protein
MLGTITDATLFPDQEGWLNVNSNDEQFYSHDNGDVQVAVQDDAIHIKVVTPTGDPVELNEHEAEELVRVLQRFISKLKDI